MGGQIDDSMVAKLLDMGYEPDTASAALRATGGADLSQAVQWLLENPDASELSGWLSINHATPSAAPAPAAPAPQQDLDAVFSPLGIGAAELEARAAHHSGAMPSDQRWPPPLPPREPDTHYQHPAAAQQQHAGDAYFHNPAAQDSYPPAWQQQPEGRYQQRQPAEQQSAAAHQQQRQYPPQPSGSGPARTSPAPSGVAGLIAREQQKAAAADRVLDSSLVDLQALMAQAQAMVDLAEQFRLQLARAPPESAGQEVMSTDLSEDLVSMGIAAPVTKETAGRKYHKELSRQLADFLRVPLERAGGMMTLPDIFCLFNRARGTELVSPDDLLQAVKHLGKVGAPVELRDFADGVRVLQSLSHSNEQVCTRIAQLVRGDGLGPALSVGGTAAALRVPLAIAQEHLLTAEACGTLCRDDGPEGLRFFRNFFAEVEVGA